MEAKVCVIGANRVGEMSEERDGEVLSAQGTEMREIKSNLAALLAQMAAMMEEVKKNRVSGYRAPSRSPCPRRGDKQGCYHWGNGTLQEGVPKIFGIAERGETSIFSGK